MNVNNEWYNALNTKEKVTVEKGLEDLKNGKTYNHKQVQEEIIHRILSPRKSK